jgi:triacylglycerol lipase
MLMQFNMDDRRPVAMQRATTKSKRETRMPRIILAHGILGFGNVLPVQPVNYFNGIKDLFEDAGHEVYCPSVPALGSLKVRSKQLADKLVQRWPGGGSPIFLLAHSMGGLDCRRMLTDNPEIAQRVRRLITVGTPHFGSPVADYLLQPSFLGLPNPLQLLTGIFVHDAGALNDLKTRAALYDNRVPNVDYLCVGCDASKSTPRSQFFKEAGHRGGFGAIPNDGVVSLASSSDTHDKASLHAVWPVDHGEAVGWPSGDVLDTKNAVGRPPQDHLDRYAQLLKVLVR